MPSAERKVANATNNNNVQVPSNQQQAVISKSGSIDSPMNPLQQVLVMVDKKVRNLDKRKVGFESIFSYLHFSLIHPHIALIL